MPRQPRRRFSHRTVERYRGQFVTVSGEVEKVLVERSDLAHKIDHVWIDVHAGDAGKLRISLSTCSRQSRAAGFDPRVWLGVVETTWTELPAPGVVPAEPLDYATIEAAVPIEYKALERVHVEDMLVAKAKRAVFVQARGELYARTHAGVHQIHSRRGSFAVPEDHIGKDGTVQFYFSNPNICEMLLFKYAGQP